ncbi:MAG: cupin domain-containing protein [Solobacterium sp.]|nr:cupin domain-containing protein [Solobacterium sp.]
MNLILLSGGSGKRLWPLSNNIRSKQFIKLFRNENGEYESMVQRMYAGIKKVDPGADITIAAGRQQLSLIHNQLDTSVDISVEPARRDTFAAIVLACTYLHDVKKISEDEPVVICPVDPYVDSSYFKALMQLSDLANAGTASLNLLGIEPTYPSEKYGYIIPQTKDEVSAVSMFREKPDVKTAEQYIAQGALWNAGVFAFRLSWILEKGHELLDFTDYYDLYAKYETVEKISFDYAVAEKEPSIQVMRYRGDWKDLGTWNTFTEAMDSPLIGNAFMDEACRNVHVINALDMPVLVMGLQNTVVAASPSGILVADKEQSSYLKPYAERFEDKVMFAEKSWGSYEVIDADDESLTIKITLKPGSRMNYHSHEHRDEMWTVIAGSGRTVVDGMVQPVKAGDVVTMQAGCCHAVEAETELKIIEVQLGKDIDVRDKIKYSWPE